MTAALFREAPRAAITASLRRTLWSGSAIAGCFFVGLGVWTAYAPLSGAAIATGVISPEGSRRTVQHLEGGIVAEILVRDGSRVEAGQKLLVLESGIARASYDVQLKDLRANLTKYWRLLAERQNAHDVTFYHDLLAGDDAAIRGHFETQRALFFSRREARNQRKQVLEQRITQLQEEIGGLRAQIASQTRQLALISEEAEGVAKLVGQGYERRARLLALHRATAEISGLRAAHQAGIAKALSAIEETRAQIDAIDSEHMEEVETQLAETAAKLAEIREKLRAAADIVSRTVITAPVSGTVVELRARTVGGVIGAGQPILDIVPSDEELLIDARISPNDIDEVRPDLPARVIMTGYSQRNLRPLEGRVRDVSADRLVDSRTGQVYYRARIELSPESVREAAPHVSLKPGMPAEVMVMTGERTLLDYLIEPLSASFRRSFRES